MAAALSLLWGCGGVSKRVLCPSWLTLWAGGLGEREDCLLSIKALPIGHLRVCIVHCQWSVAWTDGRSGNATRNFVSANPLLSWSHPCVCIQVQKRAKLFKCFFAKVKQQLQRIEDWWDSFELWLWNYANACYNLILAHSSFVSVRKDWAMPCQLNARVTWTDNRNSRYFAFNSAVVRSCYRFSAYSTTSFLSLFFFSLLCTRSTTTTTTTLCSSI